MPAEAQEQRLSLAEPLTRPVIALLAACTVLLLLAAKSAAL